METCPDCGTEVLRYAGLGLDANPKLAEADPEGDLVAMAPSEWDENRTLPWMAIARRLRGGNHPDALEGHGPYRAHNCPCRVKVDDDLKTIREVYGRRTRGPKVTVPLKRVGAEPEPGTLITLYDAGGEEWRAEIVSVEVTARLLMEVAA